MVTNKFSRPFFFMFIALASNVQAKLPLFSEAASEKIESVSESIADFIYLERYGSLPMSAENEELIQSLIHQMGIKRKVIVRKFSNSKIAAGFSKNAGTADLGSIIYMFFDENYFDSLSREEKEILVCHEASHASRLHRWVMPLVSALLVTPIVKLLDKYVINGKNFGSGTIIINPELPKEYDSRKVVLFPDSFVEKQVFYYTPIIAFILNRFVSRLCEFDADICAAKHLGDGNGGISFFERRIKDRDPESRFMLNRFFDKVIEKIGDFISTHPTDEQRIDMFEKFEEDKQASMPTLLMRHYTDNLKKAVLDVYRFFRREPAVRALR